LQRSSAHIQRVRLDWEPEVLDVCGTHGNGIVRSVEESFTSLIRARGIFGGVASDGAGMMSVSLVFGPYAGDCCYQDGLVVAMQESCEQKQRRAGFEVPPRRLLRWPIPLWKPSLRTTGTILSNTIAIVLLFALREPSLWYLDPLSAILISFYIIHSGT
jgi:hypothetical protein